MVEGAFSDGVADMLGAEMARAGVRVRVVLWHEDLGASAPSAKQRKPSLSTGTRARRCVLLRLRAALLAARAYDTYVWCAGLYACWSYLNAHVAAAEYRVRASRQRV